MSSSLRSLKTKDYEDLVEEDLQMNKINKKSNNLKIFKRTVKCIKYFSIYSY